MKLQTFFIILATLTGCSNHRSAPNASHITSLTISLDYVENNTSELQTSSTEAIDVELIANENNIEIIKFGELELNNVEYTAFKTEYSVYTIQLNISIPETQPTTVISIFSFRMNEDAHGEGTFMAYDRNRALAYGYLKVKMY